MIAKELLKIILHNRKPEQAYIEPFVGGCNMIEHVKGKCIAGDNNKYLIALLKGLQERRSRMYCITKEDFNLAYLDYKNGTNKYFDNYTIGWICYMASFSGKGFHAGYCNTTNGRNYIAEKVANVMKQRLKLAHISFHHCHYMNLLANVPDNSIIYCDPPYEGTTGYDKYFNHEQFWQWCREMKALGHDIYISEYSAPSDFKCVWQKQVKVMLNTNKIRHRVERLYCL